MARWVFSNADTEQRLAKGLYGIETKQFVRFVIAFKLDGVPVICFCTSILVQVFRRCVDQGHDLPMT